jgi:SAM-dependent methyltransferase
MACPADQLEYPACALCGSARAGTLFVARDRLLGRPGMFPVVRCGTCGLVYLCPRPSGPALSAFYPDAYYPLDAAPSAQARAVAAGLFARVQSWVRAQGLRRVHLLDVGCGTGVFLDLAQRAGWRVAGIEPGAAACAYARARFGLEVYCGTLDDAPLPQEEFDVITLWHVLEHLPRPVESLRRLRAALAPGGLLLIAVPNFASLEARLFGRRWYSLDAPRHLYHFTPATLCAVVSAAGLRPVRLVHSAGTAGLVYSIMGDLTGLSLRLRGRHLAAHTYARLATAIEYLARPLCRLAAALHRGGALELYAVKSTTG